MLTSRVLSPGLRIPGSGASKAASASRLSGKVIGRLHRWNQKGYSKNVVMAAAKEGSSARVAMPEEFKTFLEEQKQMARLTWAECSRSLMEVCGRGILANLTTRKIVEGFPSTSYALFVPDERGRPLFGLTSLSPRTREIEKDGRCSLIVLENNVLDITTRRLAMTGVVKRLEGEDADEAREMYLSKKPDARHLYFGDVGMFRMDEIKTVSYFVDVAFGGQSGGEVAVDDYLNASLDPVYEFSPPICKHMNEDHAETIPSMIKHYAGLDVDSGTMLRLDRYGFDAKLESSKYGKYPCRLEFPSPATDRKQVREAIVEMTRAATKTSQPSQ